MALKTKAAIKTQLDAVAAALTLAWADTVSGMAVDCKHPSMPIRQVMKLMDITALGVVTVNAAAWDSLWNAANTALAKSSNRGKGQNINKVIP